MTLPMKSINGFSIAGAVGVASGFSLATGAVAAETASVTVLSCWHGITLTIGYNMNLQSLYNKAAGEALRTLFIVYLPLRVVSLFVKPVFIWVLFDNADYIMVYCIFFIGIRLLVEYWNK